MLSKYRFLALFLCAVMIVSLAACGDKSDPVQTQVESSATQGEESNSTDITDITETDTFSSSNEKTEASTNTEKTEATEEPSETEEEESGPMDDFEITEADGLASVKSPEGFEYGVSNYVKVGKTGFIFKKELSFDVGKQLIGKMNKFTVSYESSIAIRLYVTYTEAGEDKEEAFYLEAGRRDFSAFTASFLDGVYSAGIKSIRAEAAEPGRPEFVIYNITTEGAEIPNQLIYIEGERYKLGIDLKWGGAISYISDKSCKIEGIDNLINCNDTGRLVQQSYYGTGKIDGVFEWGSFNGNDQWPYNPVQGGDKKFNSSRLIDLEVREDYIYIKSQPLDWGKDNYITPSYMENTYKIEDGYIRVDNRFVDFSGWDHPSTTQELPAFYTLSYLDTFVWYDGSTPWTEDALSKRSDLNFWGDAQYIKDCTFRFTEPNSETWCAWVKESDNYGIGLYVPNVDKLVAGRYKYNESKEAASGSTNYVAPINQIQLVSFYALEYSYIVTCGSVDDIRKTFTDNKDFATNESLHENYTSLRIPVFDGTATNLDFTEGENLNIFGSLNSTEVSYDSDEKAAKLTVTGGDPFCYIDYVAASTELIAENYKYLEIVYKIPTTNKSREHGCQLFFCCDTQMAPSEECSVRLDLKKDGKYHTLLIKLSDLSYWQGNVNFVRFDYFNGAENGDCMYVKTINLTNEADMEDMTKIDFEKESSLEFITSVMSTDYTFDANQNALKLKVTGDDPYIVIDYNASSKPISASEYSKVVITYMIPITNQTEAYESHLFPCAGSVIDPTGDAVLMEKNIIADGEYHTITYDLSGESFWSGALHKLRFDYVGDAEAGDLFYIKSIELVK